MRHPEEHAGPVQKSRSSPSRSAHPLALIPDDDATVAKRVIAGDTAAFETLMRRHNQRVFRAARAVLRDDTEAQDAAQQAWLSAYRNLASWEGRSTFSTWVVRIAVHEASRRIKKRGRAEHLALVPSKPDEPSSPSPEAVAARGRLRELLELEIDRLPETLRSVLVLRDIEEMSGSETASVLSLSEEVVRVRLHRARRLLRGSLATLLDEGVGEAFPFLGERCNAIVREVFATIRRSRPQV